MTSALTLLQTLAEYAKDALVLAIPIIGALTIAALFVRERAK